MQDDNTEWGSKIQILYEDEGVLVIDKPAGITVNRSDTTRNESTVQNWTEERLGIKQSIISSEEKVLDYTSNEYFQQTFLARGGIAHRLDKETSGILLVAKHWESFLSLQQQFKDRTVHKKYLALVHGKLVPSVGEINVPVDRLPWNRRQFGIVAGGRESVTYYRVVSYHELQTKPKEVASLVELEPKTGRTHQIRVHMKYMNHPIFADFLYGGRKISLKDRKLLPRVFLHAATIVFTNPTLHTETRVTSPLPDELQSFLTNNTIHMEKLNTGGE